MPKRSKAILKELFGAGAIPTGAQFIELIDSLEDALAPTTLTIVSATVTRYQKRHKIDTEGQAAADTLSTINGGADGEELILRAVDGSARAVTVDTAGNIAMDAGTHILDSVTAHLHLIYNDDTSKWNELSRSN